MKHFLALSNSGYNHDNNTNKMAVVTATVRATAIQ